MPRTPSSAKNEGKKQTGGLPQKTPMHAAASAAAQKAGADEEIRQAEMIFESSRSQLEYLEENARMIGASIAEHMRTRETLENYGDAGEMLVPIGAGVFINAKPVKADKALVSVGAGASVEMGTKDAIAHVERNIEKLNAARGKATERIAQIKEQMKSIAGRMESLYGSSEIKDE